MLLASCLWYLQLGLLVLMQQQVEIVMRHGPTILLEEQKSNSHNNRCNNYYNEGNMVLLHVFFEIKEIPYHRAWWAQWVTCIHICMHWTFYWSCFSSLFNLRISIIFDKNVRSMPFFKQSKWKSARKYLHWVWWWKGIVTAYSSTSSSISSISLLSGSLSSFKRKTKKLYLIYLFLWMVANTLFFVFRVNLSEKYKQILTPTYRPVALMDSYKIITNRLPFMWEAIKSPLWDA